MKFLRELYNRFTLTSPSFFKKLQTFGLYLSGLATTILAIPSVHDNIKDIASYVLTVGIVLAAVSKLPVIDSDVKDLDK